MIPRPFGPYELVSLLGVGGMGEVYRARDTRRGRWVALKLLPPAFAKDPEYIGRFRRESLVAARLTDPHVVPIHDFGEIDGQLFLDMRLVDGRDIGAVLTDDGPLPAGRAVSLVAQVAEALDDAHAEGLVHRDVKPSNLLVTRKDFVYVVDFGVARSIGEGSTSLTVTGATVGTLDYMAPERFTHGPIDGRTDVYSLACVLHECLTGARPFPGRDLPALMYAHLHLDPPRAGDRVAGIPPALDAVIGRGMAKRPEDRYATATELARAARGALVPPLPRLATLRPATAWAPPTVPQGWEAAPAGPPAPSTDGAGGATPDDRLPADDGPADLPADVPADLPDDAAASEDAAGQETAGEDAAGEGAGAVPAAALPRGRRLPALIAAAVLVVAGGGVAAWHWWPGADAAASEVATSSDTPVVLGTITVGRTPGYVAVSPDGRTAYVANRDEAAVTVFDTTTHEVTDTIAVPDGPAWYISLSPDGRQAYVSVKNAERTVSRLVVLDTTTDEVVTAVDVGSRPFSSAASPDGRFVYVTSHGASRVDIIDTGTQQVVGIVPVPPDPHAVVFSHDGSYAYVASHESDLVTVLNTRTQGVAATVDGGNGPYALAVSPDGNRLAVADFDGSALTVIDTASNVVLHTTQVGRHPQDVAWAPDGRHLYVANADDSTLSVVDARSYEVTDLVTTGHNPTGVAVRPDGREAYVADVDDGTVTVLDIAAH